MGIASDARVNTPPGEHYASYTDGTKPDAFAVESAIDRLNKKVKWLAGGLLLSALAIAGLLAGAIVLGVRTSENRDAARPPSAAGESTRALISTSHVAPQGFESQGTLGASSGTWAQRAQFPAPADAGTSDGAAVAVGDLVYYIGGHAGNATHGNQVSPATFIYDPLADTFAAGPALPRPVARGGAAYDGAGTLYYAAGVSRVGGAEAGLFGGPGTPCLYALDVSAAAGAGAKWKALPCMKTPRSDFCAAWSNGALHVIGGMDGGFNPVATIETYDPAAAAWSQSALQLPRGRLDLACAALGKSVYVVGGIDTPSWKAPMTTWFTDSVLALDFAAGTVEERAPLPRRRGDLAVAALGPGALLAMGGETTAGEGDGARTLIASHETFLYMASRDVWVARAPMPEARFRGAAAAAPANDGARAVVLLGGHHRCERMADNADVDDDGGCDEISAVSMYIDEPTTPLFVYAPVGPKEL